jgi:hypothetical protein
MGSVIHTENKVALSLTSVIFLVSVGIVSIQHFFGLSFGALGFIAWIVVIVGSVYFVWWILSQIFGR